MRTRVSFCDLSLWRVVHFREAAAHGHRCFEGLIFGQATTFVEIRIATNSPTREHSRNWLVTSLSRVPAVCARASLVFLFAFA